MTFRVLGRLGGTVAAFLLVGCAGPVVARHSDRPCPELEKTVEARARDAPAAAPAVYLTPAKTGGAPGCIDPDSAEARRALTSPPPELDAWIDARALAEDLGDIRPLLARHYAGWSELEQAGFDPSGFFDRWAAELKAGPERVAFRDFAERMVQLKAAARDRHFKIEGMYGFFASHPQLLVGELGEVVPFILPRTGVALSVPTKRFYPTDPIEEVGLPVDVYLTAEALGAPVHELLPMLQALPSRAALRGE